MDTMVISETEWQRGETYETHFVDSMLMAV